jgi:hypothetical protein
VDDQPPTEASAVESYLLSLAEIAAATPNGLSLSGWMRRMMRAARSGGEPTAGRLGDDWTYAFHGGGCLFTDGDGREVDVDLDLSEPSRVVWDTWRVAQHARSCGLDALTDDVSSGLEKQADAGRVSRVRPGWWGVVM